MASGSKTSEAVSVGAVQVGLRDNGPLIKAGVGAVVALGDSLTDANLSTADTNSRWTDALAAKLHAAGIRMGVMNQGTGGGRVLHDAVGDSGLRRFDRDVLAQPGVTHVVVLLGINDLRRRLSAGAPESERVSADEMIGTWVKPSTCRC